MARRVNELNSESIKQILDVLPEDETLEIENADIGNLFGDRPSMDAAIRRAGCMSRGSDDGRKTVIKKIVVEMDDE